MNPISVFFFISGATALIYEVVWLRLLGLIFGNTTYAVSTVLTAYMAGLGVGSFVVGRFASRWPRPLRVYGFLEIGIGAYAALTPFFVWLIQTVYLAFANPEFPNGPFSITLKFFLSFLIVFIPTFFMGGTLPVLTKYFLKDDKTTGSVAGLLYALNTAGAVLGTVLAGFWLLPVLGIQGTLIGAVAFNLGIGGLALLVSRNREMNRPSAKIIKMAQPVGGKVSSLALPIGLFLSGFNAMLYEIGWTRILATVLSSATYAFTIMLASFLFGIALGSWAWKKVLAKREATGIAWGWFQVAIALAAFVTLPIFPWVNLVVVRLYGLTLGHPQILFFCMSILCVLLMIIPAFCFGALFPLSSALFIQKREDASEKIGLLYLWNTGGNILGSLAAGFILIPLLGIHKMLLVAILLGAAIASVTTWVVRKKPMQNSLMFVAAVALLVGALGAWNQGWDTRFLSSGLNIEAPHLVGQKTETILSNLFNHRVLYYRDGLNSIVSVGKEGDNIYLKVNGKTDASTQGDLSTQLLLGHLPHLLHPDPKRSLVIGFGSGMTLAAVLAHPVKEVDCAEIEPAVMEAGKFFNKANRDAVKDPRVKIFVNDGRNHLLMEKKGYDVIVSEPSNPWMAGVSYLFTTDFYRLADKHLHAKGVFCQWIHAYAIRPEDFWMVVASVKKVFPHVTLWRANADDYLIIAQREPFQFDLDRIDGVISKNERVKEDLAALDILGGAALLAHFQLGEDSITKYTAEAGLNTDDLLPLEFSTPFSLYDPKDTLKNDLISAADKEKLPQIFSADPNILKDPKILIQIGRATLGMRNSAKAKQVFMEAGEDPQALTGLGQCAVVDGQKLRAAEYFEKAATAEAYDNLGQIYWQEKQWEKSLEVLEKSLALRPDSWETLYWKGQALENLNRAVEAAEAYQRSVTLGGPRLTTRLALYRAKRNAGQTEEALSGLETLRSEYPTEYPVYQELKPIYFERKQQDTLIRYYKELTRTNPYFLPAWLDLIGLYLMKGDQESLSWAMGQARKLSV